MTTPLKANLQDLNNLYSDVAAAKVPAVAYVRPLEQLARASGERYDRAL
jgi:hypothetical protein